MLRTERDRKDADPTALGAAETKECAKNGEFNVVLQTKEDLHEYETCDKYANVCQINIDRVYYGTDDVLNDFTKSWRDSEVSGGVTAMRVSELLSVLSNPNAAFGDPAPGKFKQVVLVGSSATAPVGSSATAPKAFVAVTIPEKHCKLGFPVKIDCFDHPVASYEDVLDHKKKCEIAISGKRLSYLRVHEASASKARVGSVRDGGYVIVDGHDYDCLLSCGISDDVTFEECFMKRCAKPLKGYAFDGTIDSLPKPVERLEWKKQNIGQFETPKTTNLHRLIEMHENAFLKMDIESHEYRWFQTLSPNHMSRLKQIVVEFHFAFGYHPAHDVGLSVCEKLSVLEIITQTHVLVHLHANNCCGVTTHQGIVVPNIFECTYLRKDCHIDKGYCTTGTPNKMLDMPNVQHAPEISLQHYPFKATCV